MTEKKEKLRLPKLKGLSKGPEGEKTPEETAGEKRDTGFLRMTGTLCLLCAVCGLLLGLANLLTEDRIAKNQGSRYMGALEEVLPYGGNYRELRYSGSDSSIDAVYEAPEAGWVFQVSPPDSYSGTLTLMVGVNMDGTVSGVAVVESGETEELGALASEPEFRTQFTGKSGSVRLEADGGSISAISGATITSGAVCTAVNSALSIAAGLE